MNDQFVIVQGVPMHVVHWEALGPAYWEGSYCDRRRLNRLALKKTGDLMRHALDSRQRWRATNIPDVAECLAVFERM